MKYLQTIVVQLKLQKTCLDAKKFGFNAVKLQTYTADCMTHKDINIKFQKDCGKERFFRFYICAKPQ